MTKAKALEVLKTYDMSEDNEDREFCEALTMAISALEQKPFEVIHRDRTVQDFVDKCLECGRIRKGHWITTDYFKFTCSECGWEGNCDTKFCSNCGAKMESEDKE